MSKPYDHQIVIVGGGTAGITVASQLLKRDPPLDVAIIEPSETHYYQPLWTLVGGGVFEREESARSMKQVIPRAATWIRDRAATFQPDEDQLTLASGDTVSYEQLVVAPGIQLDWDAVEGLDGHVGDNGICSNYSWDTVESTWQTLRNFSGGRAIFTFPNTPIKCAGAPQKIMWLAEHYLSRNGVRENSEIVYHAPGAAIFGVQKYRDALEELVDERDVKTVFRSNLVAVRPDEQVAVFEDLDSGETSEVGYDMLHVTPPQSAPDFIKQSPLANDDGWVEVDKDTTQHVRYPNVFSLGDASSLPTSKTGAAVRKEAPVTTANLLALRNNEPLEAVYDGYASCPLVTGYGRLILAEFDYDGNPAESFPFDQARERYSMYAMKAYGLPKMYWHGMLEGRA
ncbi:MAG: FAD-dependent oxidoreductase [Persicimonas sp.]